jgi:hypothetical protein
MGPNDLPHPSPTLHLRTFQASGIFFKLPNASPVFMLQQNILIEILTISSTFITVIIELFSSANFNL